MLPRFRPDQYLSLVIIIVTVLLLPTRIVAAQPLKPIVQLKPFPELNQNLLLALPPSSQFNPNALSLTARSALVIDLKNPSILYEKAATARYPQASLTKLMTALVARDLYQPDQIIEIKPEDLTDGNIMGLKIGEKITVDSLLKGLLIYSGNDAALAFANNHPNGPTGFMAAMNQKAQQLHLTETQFKNAAGFDEDGHFSSSFDIALLAKTVLEVPELRSILATQQTTVTDVTGEISHELISTNDLLFTDATVLAGKTGTTPLALECLMTVVNQEDHPILIVLLGSQNRYLDTERLIAWVYHNYKWITPNDRSSIGEVSSPEIQ